MVCVCVCVTSLPRGIPLPRAQVRPMTLATKVLKVRYSFSTTPRRMVFISGIPEPVMEHSRQLQLTVNLKVLHESCSLNLLLPLGEHLHYRTKLYHIHLPHSKSGLPKATGKHPCGNFCYCADMDRID